MHAVVAGFDLVQKGILRVEARRVTGDVDRTVQAAGAGFGEDLYAAETKAVILGGEGVLVDLYGADGVFWRKLAAAEAVDVNLRSVLAIAAGECGELLLKRGVVIGEVAELLVGERERAAVGVFRGAAAVVAAHADDRLRGGDHEFRIDGDMDSGGFEGGEVRIEALGGNHELIGACGQGEAETAAAVGCRGAGENILSGTGFHRGLRNTRA